jgi:hypothetical protein
LGDDPVSTCHSCPTVRYTSRPEPDEGPGLTWRQLARRHWSGTCATKIRGTVTRDGDGWVAYLRLEPDRPVADRNGGTVRHRHEAMVATDEMWSSR